MVLSSQATKEEKSVVYTLQQLSMVVWRGNVASVLENRAYSSLPANSEPQLSSSQYIHACSKAQHDFQFNFFSYHYDI